MENIFDRLTKDIPKHEAPAKPAPAFNVNADPYATPIPEKWTKETILPVVGRWRDPKTRKKGDMEALLNYLDPTIKSALRSYAPQQESGLRASAATIALNSMSLFDPDKDTDPATYAFNSLKRLSRLSADRSSIIRLPENARYSIGHLQDASARFEDRYGREPSVMELADMTGLAEKRIKTLLGYPSVVSETSTLNEETGDPMAGNGKALTDEDYYDYVYRSVPDTDKKIMEWTSGIGAKAVSNNEIAKRLHISPAAVSQRKAKIQQMLSDVRGLL